MFNISTDAYWVAGAVPALLPSPHSQADSHVLGHPLLPSLRSQRVGTRPLRRSHKADFEHLKLVSVPLVFLNDKQQDGWSEIGLENSTGKF